MRSKQVREPGGTTASERLMRFVCGLPRGYIFTSRDLLPYAHRTSVDAFTSHLVNVQYLERLTRGVFRVYHPTNPVVTAREVAAVKLRAFGRELIAISPGDGNVTGFEDELNNDCVPDVHEQIDGSVVVGSSGCSSSFIVNGTRVICKSIPPRQQILGSSKGGKVLRDVWLDGRANISSGKFESTIAGLNKKEIEALSELKTALPNWLGRLIKPKLTVVKTTLESVE